MFTDRELEIARMRLKGQKNKDIAKKLGFSESYISQTVKKITQKVKTVQDSIVLLEGMEVIKEGPKYILTEKGRNLSQLPESNQKVQFKSDTQLSPIDYVRYMTGNFHNFNARCGITSGNDIILKHVTKHMTTFVKTKKCISSNNGEPQAGMETNLPKRIELTYVN